MDNRRAACVTVSDEDDVLRRIDMGVRALAAPRRACAATTRDRFARGNALKGEGFASSFVGLIASYNADRHSRRACEQQPALDALELAGLIDSHLPPRQHDAEEREYGLTPLAEALLPILRREGLASPFVWYVLWVNLSCAWLGAMSWNMLSRTGPSVPLLVEPLCSYLCGEDVPDSEDRGAASSLEESFRNTPWGSLGIGIAPAYSRRLWTRRPSQGVDPLVLLYGLYKSAEVSDMLTVDGDQLAHLPYGPSMALGVEGADVVRQLLSLWLPGLMMQRRQGSRVIFSVQPARSAVDVVVEYARRRGYQ